MTTKEYAKLPVGTILVYKKEDGSLGYWPVTPENLAEVKSGAAAEGDAAATLESMRFPKDAAEVSAAFAGAKKALTDKAADLKKMVDFQAKKALSSIAADEKAALGQLAARSSAAKA